MVNRSTETYTSHKIFTTVDHQQLFISVPVTLPEKDPECTIEAIYQRIAELLVASSSHIVHERCYGDLQYQQQLLRSRTAIFKRYDIDSDTPVTFIEGRSCRESKFAGVQLRAIIPHPKRRVWTIRDEGVPKGRAWSHNGTTFYILQGVDGWRDLSMKSADRLSQSEAMFHQADKLLQRQGTAFRNVVRTWIYLSDILDWYGDFNAVRNQCYCRYGFLGSSNEAAENIFLPASTGIEGKNPAGPPATMDVFAVHRSPCSLTNIRPTYGKKQGSPYRYGSAFSRAIVVEEPKSKLILVSGTASIDREGKSVFLNDVEAQIHHTFDVISSLIGSEGATMQDICESTVFLKRKEDFPIFQALADQMGFSSAPSIHMVADVCRDELLFEIDAAFLLEKITS
jgi:enamine deaminase RidA (YjgF/YER057c/UK114 family)